MAEGAGEGDKGQATGNLPKEPELHRRWEAFKRFQAGERLRSSFRELIRVVLWRMGLREEIHGDLFQGYWNNLST